MKNLILATFLALLFLTGCSAGPVNPSFPVTDQQAHLAIDSMRESRRTFCRPLVIIGGFMDPDISPLILASFFSSISRDATIIPVSVAFCGNFEECRQSVIDAVDKAFPTDDVRFTREVDVVGVSLGGLVGRYAAAPSLDPKHHRQLKIARLFTISSPLAGAKLASFALVPSFSRDLQLGSAFEKYLAARDEPAQYQLYPYVLLGDEIVGQGNAAPPGKTPYWLANKFGLFSHAASATDDRILADISRRLRYETAFSLAHPAPLPN